MSILMHYIQYVCYNFEVEMKPYTKFNSYLALAFIDFDIGSWT